MRVNCQNIFVTIKATSENMTKEVMSALANKKKFTVQDWYDIACY